MGLGTKKDLQEAIFWYRRAAGNDDREALGNLALHYEKGEGVKANLRKAFSLYKRAAELGDGGLSATLRWHILMVSAPNKTWQKASSGFKEPRAKETLKRNITWVYCTVMANACDEIVGKPEGGGKEQESRVTKRLLGL